MKKTFLSLVTTASIMSLVCFISCKKEETANDTQFRATMENCTSQNGKTILDGTNLNWVNGDRIAVYGTYGRGIYSATPQNPATTAIFDNVSGESGNPTFRAYYPSTLTNDGVNITIPATQTYVEGSIHEFPMYAESNDNTLAFKNLCGALKLHLTKAHTNISFIHVIADREINGGFSIISSSEGPVLSYSSNGTSTTTLSCSTAQSIADGKDFFVYLPAGSYSGLRIEIYTDDGCYCVKTANTSISVSRSRYTQITLESSDLEFHIIGSIAGLFTINGSGDQVVFSQGNLQYQASTDTWRFAEHQYDYVGGIVGSDTYGNVYEGGVRCNNLLASSTYSGWIDLFCWGTSGWNSGAYYYMPYNVGSWNNFLPGRSYFNDLTGSYAEADWAWHNPIVNGGNAVHQWRTLTFDEWEYLLFNRTNTTNLPTPNARFAYAQVFAVRGLIIFPDNYVHPTDVFQPLNINAQLNDNGTYNAPSWDNWNYHYSVSDWQKMEANGAVFLPAAGTKYRSGTQLYLSFVNSSGTYWSTTNGDDPTSSLGIGFSDNLVQYGRPNKNSGVSVRPVRDCE